MENVEALDPEDFFSAAVQGSPDSISISRLEDGSFLQVNDAFLDMTGYRREEVIGKNSRELRIWTEEGERERFLALLSESGRVRDLDVRFGMKAGDIRNVQISAAIVRIGGKDCITAACRDVTSLRAMFERLEKGSFLLERAEEMADIGSWEFDYATGRVTGSPGARRIYGLDEGEFSVEAVETVPLQQYRSMLDKARDALINDGIPYDVECEIRRKSDGAVRVVHSRARWDPVNTRLFGVIRDVTEAKETAAGLKRALAEKETLIRELYHRTKNNMQVISSLLGLEADRADQPGLREILEEVQRRIDAMALVHEMLYQSSDLSRIQLGDFMRSLVELLRSSLGDHGGKIRFSYEVEDVELLMDAAVPCGIILNELATNAMIHAFPGDRSGTISFKAGRDAEGVAIEVRDDGVGMGEGRASEDPKGMGLSLVSSIGRFQLGGTVDFDSGSGGFGCTLRFKDSLSEE